MSNLLSIFNLNGLHFKSEVMTYGELVDALNQYFNSPPSTGRYIFLFTLSAATVIFFVWFIHYLYTQYKKELAETDTFKTNIADDISYPGFRKGGVPTGDNPVEKDKKKINDEY